MKNNRMLFEKQLIMAIEESKIFTPEKKKLLEENKDNFSIFPNPYTVYNKGLVVAYLGRKIHLHKKKNNNIHHSNLNSNSKKQNNKHNFHILYYYNNLTYKIRKLSRFNFADDSNKDEENKIAIPYELTSFISKNFHVIQNSNNQKTVNYRIIDSDWSYLLEHLKGTLQRELSNIEKKMDEELNN